MNELIAKIQGGLGNQLFIYAAARSFADKYNYKLYFDLSNYINDYRKFELDKFNIRFDGQKEYKNKDISNSKILRFINTVFKVKNKEYIHVTDENIDILEKLKRTNLYFDGYFQSEKYINKTQIVSDLRLFGNDSFEQRVNLEKNCCIMHIRRGDYLNFPHNLTHLVLSKDYYIQSFQYIKKIEDNIKFYAVTDDIQWVKHNFPNVELLSENFKDPLIDFYLMTKAKYLITANSSFSWWAAFLNNREDKVILQPKKWKKITTRSPEQLVNGWVKF